MRRLPYLFQLQLRGNIVPVFFMSKRNPRFLLVDPFVSSPRGAIKKRFAVSTRKFRALDIVFDFCCNRLVVAAFTPSPSPIAGSFSSVKMVSLSPRSTKEFRVRGFVRDVYALKDGFLFLLSDARFTHRGDILAFYDDDFNEVDTVPLPGESLVPVGLVDGTYYAAARRWRNNRLVLDIVAVDVKAREVSEIPLEPAKFIPSFEHIGISGDVVAIPMLRSARDSTASLVVKYKVRDFNVEPAGEIDVGKAFNEVFAQRISNVVSYADTTIFVPHRYGVLIVDSYIQGTAAIVSDEGELLSVTKLSGEQTFSAPSTIGVYVNKGTTMLSVASADDSRMRVDFYVVP